MTCEEGIAALQEAKNIFCSTGSKGIILAKIKIKLKVLVCCDEEDGGGTTTTTTSTTTTTTTTEEVTTTTSTSTSTTTVDESPGLRILFNNIENMPFGINTPTDVSEWNTFFNLPTDGTPFTSAWVSGNQVTLVGGGLMNLKYELFKNNTDIIEVEDQTGIVVTADNSCFYNCSSVTLFDFPNLTETDYGSFYGCTGVTQFSFPSLEIAGDSCFFGCSSATLFALPNLITALNYCFFGCSSNSIFSFLNLTSIGNSGYFGCTSVTVIDTPLCATLGTTTGDDGVFSTITGNTITVNVPTSLATANGGNPDGDLVSLLAANPGSTINYI